MHAHYLSNRQYVMLESSEEEVTQKRAASVLPFKIKFCGLSIGSNLLPFSAPRRGSPRWMNRKWRKGSYAGGGGASSDFGYEENRLPGFPST